MKRLDSNGGVAAIVAYALLAMLLVGALAFGVWAYQGRQDYKNNVDQKVAVAVAAAKQQQITTDNKQFAEKEKQPLVTYSGPEAFGSIIVKYPKKWSSYVDTTGTNSSPVNGYFYPGTVPAVSDQTQTFALRLQVLNQTYSDVLASLNSQQQTSAPKVAPYHLPLVPSVVGVRVDGQVQENKNGSMVVLPLRDKTIEVWTESQQFLADFNNNILPNLSFSP
ncbi:MAG TPA: hypothetical protein VLG13_02415 [Patescibacteria group bacterium]|nr:hypothetical protein [Patescibacteria group bacterium]